MKMANRAGRLFPVLMLLTVLFIGGTVVQAAGSNLIIARVKTGKNKATVTWNKAAGAERYLVFFHACDGKRLTNKVQTLGKKKTSYTRIGLSASKCYKFRIAAQKKSGGKYVTISSSNDVHIAAYGNKTLTNAQSVTVKPGAALVYAGDTFTLKASAKRAEAGKKLLGKTHGTQIRYYSSDPEIASVNRKSGKVITKKAGSCVIYAVALNGVYKAVKVKVREAGTEKVEVPDPGNQEDKAAKSYTVVYKYDGDVPAGAPAVPAEKEYKAGDAVAKAAAPSVKGYTFKGWYGEVTKMPEKDVVVTGHWKLNKHKVKFVYTNPLTKKEVVSSVVYGYGEAVSAIGEPDIRGYKFDGWKDVPTTMPDEDVTVTGTFTKLCKVRVVMLANQSLGLAAEEDERGPYQVLETLDLEVEPGTLNVEDLLKVESVNGRRNASGMLEKTVEFFNKAAATERILIVDAFFTDKNKRKLAATSEEIEDLVEEAYDEILEALYYEFCYGWSLDDYIEEFGIPALPSALPDDFYTEMGFSDRQKYIAQHSEFEAWDQEVIQTLRAFFGEYYSGEINDDVMLIGWIDPYIPPLS